MTAQRPACVDCGRPFRTHWNTPEPGTVRNGGRGLCDKCRSARRRADKPLPLTGGHEEVDRTVLARFRGIWEVTDEDANPAELRAHAMQALPAVAARAGARSIIGPTKAFIAPGRHVPGSGGARTVLVIDTTVRAGIRAAKRAGIVA